MSHIVNKINPFAGTKQDLRLSQNDCVTLKEAKKMRKRIGAVKYVECSALTNEGLDAIFVEAVLAATHKPKKNCFSFSLDLFGNKT